MKVSNLLIGSDNVLYVRGMIVRGSKGAFPCNRLPHMIVIDSKQKVLKGKKYANPISI